MVIINDYSHSESWWWSIMIMMIKSNDNLDEKNYNKLGWYWSIPIFITNDDDCVKLWISIIMMMVINCDVNN